MPQTPRFEIEVVHGDAITFETEVLMIKHSPGSGGMDARVRTILAQSKKLNKNDLPATGSYRVYESTSPLGAQSILIVGTVTIGELDYQQIRELGRNMLVSLAESDLIVSQVATTAHGINTRLALDEVEAFRSLLLGFADAAEEGLIPDTLKKITVVEFVTHRADLFREALQKFLPPTPTVEDATRETVEELVSILAGSESLDEEAQKPLADETTPHIFVAMPFADDFDDHYYLAIRPAISDNNILCVRLDQDDVTFTGDIMEQVKERIRSAQLVVALLDTRNPNVYLEVGYAWGVRTPTILVLHEEEEVPFDVQGAKLITYRRMHKLKDDLTREIKRLIK